jgi:gas vesicle protein
MNKLFNFVLGLSLGMATGFAVAMLLAPESGDETRRLIQERKEHIIQEAKRARAEREAELYAQLEELKKGSTPTS